MRINNNIMAMNAHRQLGANQANASKAMEKLSSGFRINRAGDDAAGLAISEKMRGQIRGLKQASRNAQDGISLIQTAEGALNETHSILQRMRELAVQAATDTNTDEDRAEIQKEIDELATEITRISTDTEFNNQKVLNGGYNDKIFHIGSNEGQSLKLSINNMSANELKVGVASEADPTDPTEPTEPKEPKEPTEPAQASVEVTKGLAAGSTAGISEITGDTEAIEGPEVDDANSFDLKGEYKLEVTASSSGNNYTAALTTVGGTEIDSGVVVSADTSGVKIGGLKFKLIGTEAPAADGSVSVTFQATPYVAAVPGVDSLDIAEETELEAGDYTLTIAYDSSDGGSVAAKLVGADGTIGTVAITSAGDYEIEGITFAISTANIPGSGDNDLEVEFTVTIGSSNPKGPTEKPETASVTFEVGGERAELSHGTTTVDGEEITVNGSKSEEFNDVTITFATAASSSGVGAEVSSGGSITINLEANEKYPLGKIADYIKALGSAYEDFFLQSDGAGGGIEGIEGSKWVAANPVTLSGGTEAVPGTEVTITGPQDSAYNDIIISVVTEGPEEGKASFANNEIKIEIDANKNYSAEDIQNLIRGLTAEGLDFSEFTVAGGEAAFTGSDWAMATMNSLLTLSGGSQGTGSTEPEEPEEPKEQKPADVTIGGIDVSTQIAADQAITVIDEAIVTVSGERSKLGAIQNRLEHTIANLGTSAENLQAAEARIRDLDMAEEIMEFTKNNILQQAATSMLAQANMAPQTVLQLLG